MHVRAGVAVGVITGLFLPEIVGFFGGLKARRDLKPIITPADFQSAFIEARKKAMEQ
jgi:hypothetical protein